VSGPGVAGGGPAGGGWPTGGEAPPVVLHVAPHADDELIGAPATLMALREAGWRVVNLAASLGPPHQRERRRRELAEACARAGFGCEVVAEPLDDPLGAGDAAAAGHRLGAAVEEALRRHAPRVVVAPSPHDRHRGHEIVGRSVLETCAAVEPPARPERLWLWGLWADLPFPSLAVGFDQQRLDEILDALAAHAGELARNDYRRLVRGRAEMNASLGPERVFGFGHSGAAAAYVELVTELGLRHGHWHLGAPRWLDAGAATGGLGPVVLDSWLSEPSLTDRFGPPG
jgi:LmbE family N-acetylglucosaminyl deacetylase